MRVLITGASSGIGRDMSREFAKRGYDLILVARDEKRLEEVKNELKSVNVEIISTDLSSVENCKMIYEKVKDIDILVNNAGFRRIWRFL